MNIHADYYDERDCEHCGATGTVNIEGTYAEAYGECSECGEPMWVYRDEELYYEKAEQDADYRRDEGW